MLDRSGNGTHPYLIQVFKKNVHVFSIFQWPCELHLTSKVARRSCLLIACHVQCNDPSLQVSKLTNQHLLHIFSLGHGKGEMTLGDSPCSMGGRHTVTSVCAPTRYAVCNPMVLCVLTHVQRD